jgi:hypothetical protein
MSKKIMVLWFYVVFGLILSICLIGVKQKDFKYEKLKEQLVDATKQYMSDKKYDVEVSDSLLVYVSDLIKEKYVREDDLKDYCFDNIVYYNGIFQDDYEINEECKIEK